MANDTSCLLVTGANGFLGSEIVRQAMAAGLFVRATDRDQVSRCAEVEYYCGDILDPDSLKLAVLGVSGVVHTAGLAHVFGRKQVATAPFTPVNEHGTANVARVAAEAGVQHFVLVSSVSVYGGSGSELCDEASPCRPASAYAESKWRAELRATEVARATGMGLTILRMATIYGEGDPGNVGRLMRSIDRGRFIWIGTGSNRKSLIHREDAARACLVAVTKSGPGISTYNVSAPYHAMREVVEGFAAALSRRLPRWHIPAALVLGLSRVVSIVGRGRGRLGTLHTTVEKWLADDMYDADKFWQAFDFSTQVKLAEGLAREVAWYREHQNV